MLTTLKGHAGNARALDFSINGKYMVSASDDRTLRLWSVKEFGSGNKCVRVNVELDHGKLVRFSPDSRALIVGLAQANTVRVFKLSKHDGAFACTPLEKDFPGDIKQDLLSIGIGTTSEGGSYVMTSYKDTSMTVYDLKGEILNNINTNFGQNNYAVVSPCGRFIAASGWAPDVKIWEVCFTRTGDFKQVNRAFELKGHKSSVWSFAFNNDSSRMLTVSKDGFWRYFDTRIEYQKGQDPSLINSGELEVAGFPFSHDFCYCALSPDGKVGAVAMLNNIALFSTRTGAKSDEFVGAHSEYVASLAFDISGRYLASTGDRHIHVFHNVLGYTETIHELESKIKVLPDSVNKERLKARRNELKESLDLIESGEKK